MEQTPHGTPEEPKGGMCVLSVIIIVIGIVMTAITIGNAKELATDTARTTEPEHLLIEPQC